MGDGVSVPILIVSSPDSIVRSELANDKANEEPAPAFAQKTVIQVEDRASTAYIADFYSKP